LDAKSGAHGVTRPTAPGARQVLSISLPISEFGLTRFCQRIVIEPDAFGTLVKQPIAALTPFHHSLGQEIQLGARQAGKPALQGFVMVLPVSL